MAQTCLMSSLSTRPEPARISPPTTNTGVMKSMPGRMPMPSQMAPTIGRTMSPGMTQMAPSEKPIDRARGGMPSDRAANTPGPTMARVAAMAMLATIVSHNQGASANTAAKAPHRKAARPGTS